MENEEYSLHHPRLVFVAVPTIAQGRSALAQCADRNSPGGHMLADVI